MKNPLYYPIGKIRYVQRVFLSFYGILCVFNEMLFSDIRQNQPLTVLIMSFAAVPAA